MTNKVINIGVPVDIYSKVGNTSTLKFYLYEGLIFYMGMRKPSIEPLDKKTVTVAIRVSEELDKLIRQYARLEEMTIVTFTAKLINWGCY